MGKFLDMAIAIMAEKDQQPRQKVIKIDAAFQLTVNGKVVDIDDRYSRALAKFNDLTHQPPIPINGQATIKIIDRTGKLMRAAYFPERRDNS